MNAPVTDQRRCLVGIAAVGDDITRTQRPVRRNPQPVSLGAKGLCGVEIAIGAAEDQNRRNKSTDIERIVGPRHWPRRAG